MAESDWTIFGADAATIRNGPTAYITPPNGGGHFTFGFNSQVSGAEAVGWFKNGTNFAPLRDDTGNATGGSIQAAMKRAQSASPLSFSVGMFCCLQALSVSDYAYILGLSDNDPHEIVLAKTTLESGLDPIATTVLRKSSETFLVDTWVHLRLDVIANPNGDVVLNCYKSDLDDYDVTAPSWQAIPGMASYIDDALGIATGSNPMAGGYIGFFFQSEISEARAFIDHCKVARAK